MTNLAPLPEVGEEYWFYANDQVKQKTELRAKVKKVIPFKDGEKECIFKYDDYFQEVIDYPIMDLWLEQQPELFWILAEVTDYFIELSIPELCPQSVFAARDVDGGWHSFETHSSLQFGILDVTGDLYVNLHEDLPEM